MAPFIFLFILKNEDASSEMLRKNRFWFQKEFLSYWLLKEPFLYQM